MARAVLGMLERLRCVVAPIQSEQGRAFGLQQRRDWLARFHVPGTDCTCTDFYMADEGGSVCHEVRESGDLAGREGILAPDWLLATLREAGSHTGGMACLFGSATWPFKP